MTGGLTSRLLKTSLFAGCSKMPRCKAPEILRNAAYFDVRRNKPAPCLTRGRIRETQQMGVFQQPDRGSDARGGPTGNVLRSEEVF